MSIWGKIGRIFGKVGETVVETAGVVVHVTALEQQILSLKKDPFAAPTKIAAMLNSIEAIKAGVHDIRH